MNSERAFSDTEIVTIALVAASALGGIVIGLGRGGERDAKGSSESSGIVSSVARAVDAGSALIPSLSGANAPDRLARMRARYGDLEREKAREFAQRAASSLDARQALGSVRKRVPSDGFDRASGIGESLRSLGAGILEAGMANASEIDLNQIRSEVLSSLGRPALDGPSETSEEAESQGGVLNRVASGFEAVEEGVSASPDKLHSASERTGRVIRRRVTSPVAHAASATGDLTKEAFAALAWLGLGAVVVYFGLLSDERREQVKAGLCATIEQARLLMLDLQGYEPEM